jgi:hypothetical protein
MARCRNTADVGRNRDVSRVGFCWWFPRGRRLDFTCLFLSRRREFRDEFL